MDSLKLNSETTTNGDLIRRVFPLLTDEAIAELLGGPLPCELCPKDEVCGGPYESFCYNSLLELMKQEGKIGEAHGDKIPDR